MNTQVIAFTGKLESGKTTAASFAMLHFYQSCKPILITAFAKPMKDIAKEFFRYSDHALYTPDGKKVKHPIWDLTAREFLQKFGQGMRDLICPDVWVKLTQMEIKEYLRQNKDGLVFIDDLRMENEAKMVKELGGTIVRVVRPDHEAISTGLSNHPSEAGIPDEYVDHTILNDGEKHELEKQVEDLLRFLGY